MARERKRKISPQKAVKILKEHGTTVSLEEAKIILETMYKFGKLAVSQELKKSKI